MLTLSLLLLSCTHAGVYYTNFDALLAVFLVSPLLWPFYYLCKVPFCRKTGEIFFNTLAENLYDTDLNGKLFCFVVLCFFFVFPPSPPLVPLLFSQFLLPPSLPLPLSYLPRRSVFSLLFCILLLLLLFLSLILIVFLLLLSLLASRNKSRRVVTAEESWRRERNKIIKQVHYPYPRSTFVLLLPLLPLFALFFIPSSFSLFLNHLFHDYIIVVIVTTLGC